MRTAAIKRLYWTFRSRGARATLKELMFPHNWLGDCVWSIDDYRRIFGRFPNLLAPRRFSEHLLRLKLSRDARSELRARISDKEFVKTYVETKLGNSFTPTTIAVLRSKREALHFRYPDTCIIKPTHMSGEVIIRNGEMREPDPAKIARWFDSNYYNAAREPNYRRLSPKVMVEERLVSSGQHSIPDYKVFCFHGQPKIIQVDADRYVRHRRSFYSPNWRVLPFGMIYPRLAEPVPRPARLSEMLDAAKRISVDFTFVRVDFYLLDSAILVGEITNFPEACRTRFEPDQADLLAGRLFVDSGADVERLFHAILP